MSLRTINDLKKEFPEEKYVLIKSEYEIYPRLFGSYVDGNYELWIGSPNVKGAKQPVLYRELNNEHHIPLKRIISLLKDKISENNYHNDLNYNARALQNQKLQEAIGILESNDEGRIPYMVVTRDDLLSLYEGMDDFDDRKKKIESLSEEQLQAIADKMSDSLLQDYSLVLKETYEYLLEQ